MTRARLARGVAVAVAAMLFAAPLALMFLGSLQTPGLPPADGLRVIPELVRWANYQSVFQLVDLAVHVRNSLLVAMVAVPVTVLIASWAGYAIVASSARMRRFLVVVTVLALMVPTGVLLIPRFVLFRWVGIIDSLWALISPALMATSPFFVLIFAFVYSRIPRELLEAARLEGLSEFSVWRRVAWPLGKPAAFAVAVLAFVFHWSNFVEAVLYISDRELYTLPLGLRLLHTLEPALLSLLLTGAVVATLPPVLAFLAAQRALFTRTLEGR